MSILYKVPICNVKRERRPSNKVLKSSYIKKIVAEIIKNHVDID